VPLTVADTSTTVLPVSSGAGEFPGKLRRWAPGLCLALISVVYLVPACTRAANEKLWYDEIWSFDAATLPSIPALWSYLKQGVEFNPPLGFVFAAASESIFGRTELGLRFPSIVGFWVMALCLYVFLRRRIPWPFAMAGTLLTALTAAGRYSYEARPYALALAFAGIALVAWQAAAEDRSRPPALVGIALALAAALCSVTFAVTLALPFLAGEITRTVQRKRVDWAMWWAFASATPALLILWKLKTAGNVAAHWRFVGSMPFNIRATYMQMLGPAFVPLVLAFLLMLASRLQGARSAPRAPGMRAYEMAALAGFALIPFAAVPLSTVGGMYYLRYSLSCAIGLAGLIAVLLFRVGGTSRLSGATALAAIGLVFTIVQFLPEEQRPDYGLKFLNSSEKIQPFLERMPSDAPIAIGAPMTFMELEHYSSAGLAARLYYLTDPVAAAAIDGNTLFDVKTPLVARHFPFRAHYEDYRSFIATHKRFYVVEPVRNIAREHSLGRLNLQARETPDHFQYYEASPR
jgi:hypothetical protein